MLSKKYRLKVGLSGVIEGSLSIGGLSSSAAVTIAFLSALCKVNEINVSEEEMILLAQSAENEYVGVSCGKLDQSCEVFSKKGKLLYLDTKESSFELVESGKNIKPYKIAIIFSGLSRSLGSTKYNMRVDECRSAAYALMAFSGVEYGKFKDACLRDVPFETYVKYKDRLPLAWQKRAEHFYTEQARVERGVKAWRDGDIETFGKLCFESGKSSIDNYETGSLELIKLYEIMLNTKGVYGGRFSGAGFKGCCMAIIDPSFENEIKENITKEYLEIFPQYKDKFSIHICDTADGVKL